MHPLESLRPLWLRWMAVLEVAGADQVAQKLTSLWHCLWGLLFLAIAGGLFAYTLFHGLTHIADLLTQVVVPGSAELRLQSGRMYTVFLEEESVVNGRIYSTPESVAALECRVKSLQNGAAVALEKPSMNASYEFGGRSGHSVLEFPIQQAGKYEFACDYGENATGPAVVVAVGSGVTEAIFKIVSGALLILFGGIGACLAVGLFVFLKRRREMRRIAELGQAQV